jgi:hypothetical protein
MSVNRKRASITGVLLIVATVVDQLSTVLTKPVMDAPDYLLGIAEHHNQMLIGALLAFVATAASAGIAISFYPVLKRYSEALALGAVVFRLIEAMCYLVGILGLLLLVVVGQAFVQASNTTAVFWQIAGTLLQLVRFWAYFVLGVCAFSLGALLYYIVLYQSRLIPRWLSGWGMLGVILAFSAAVFMMFGGKPFSIVMILLILPIAVQEMVMALWLLIKGFNPSAFPSNSAPAFRPSSMAVESV